MKVYFHNRTVRVTKDSYAYVYEYKKQLLYNLELYLCYLNIKHVISHGNLIEYERGKPIYHDDDIDIRIDYRDLSKLNFSILSEYNLHFQYMRGLKYLEKGYTYNWYHASLIKFVNKGDIQEINMPICADIVCSMTNGYPWIAYDIDFTNLREIIYMDINTFAPSHNDTARLLALEYGKNWITPNYNLYNLD